MDQNIHFDYLIDNIIIQRKQYQFGFKSVMIWRPSYSYGLLVGCSFLIYFKNSKSTFRTPERPMTLTWPQTFLMNYFCTGLIFHFHGIISWKLYLWETHINGHKHKHGNSTFIYRFMYRYTLLLYTTCTELSSVYKTHINRTHTHTWT